MLLGSVRVVLQRSAGDDLLVSMRERSTGTKWFYNGFGWSWGVEVMRVKRSRWLIGLLFDSCICGERENMIVVLVHLSNSCARCFEVEVKVLLSIGIFCSVSSLNVRALIERVGYL